MTRYSQWVHFGDYTPFNYAYDVDETTKAAIQRFDTGTPPVLSGGTLDSDNDNTALKRLMPLAFWILTKNQQYTFNETVADMVHDYTATTNRTPKTFIGSGVLTNVIIRLIQNPNKYAMLRAVKEALDYLLPLKRSIRRSGAVFWAIRGGSLPPTVEYEVKTLQRCDRHPQRRFLVPDEFGAI